MTWSTLSRGARIGGLVVPLSLGPFLFLAGWALMNSSAKSVQPVTGEQIAGLVGVVVVVLYVVVVLGVPMLLGAAVGSVIGSIVRGPSRVQ
jgi:hypothetical protein